MEKISESTTTWNEDDFEESLLTNFDLEKACTLSVSKLRNDERYQGFDNNTGDNWIYPNNLPVRSYQFEIARNSLFRNTLVVLPTGLGKTLIAAVVIYNIYRWYPTGKVIFMAPTRPLVSQQIEACCKIMGIPMSETSEMTGNKRNSSRHSLWHSKRVFFATPQTVQVDISDESFDFPFDAIKLVIVDEAHKAKGRYAYTEVVQQINAKNPYFRVVGLSATPGRRLEDVMEIVQNLLITQIEHRNENSIDVQKYVQKKHIKIVPVDLDEDLKMYRNELLEILDPYVRTLLDNSIVSGTAGTFNKNLLIYEQKRFEKENSVRKHPNEKEVKTSFSVAISLYHVLELLERHGLRVFINYFETEDEKEKFLVYIIPRLKKMVFEIREKIGPNPFSISVQTMPNGRVPEVPKNLDFGHPKFEQARKFILDHFEKNKDSKAIVFCEYRESVSLIYRLLLQHRPTVKPRSFVGQGSSASIRAVTQKEQLQIMEDFKKGVCNTLIATSVAEEGLDVGEVDLIICFDICTTNPTRFIQRIGRTGRKRQGNVIILATEGKELANSKDVISNKDSSNLKLFQHRDLKNAFYKECPRIVPPEFNPKAIQTYITIPEENKTKSSDQKKNGSKKKKEAPISGTQDVRKFFQKIDPKAKPAEPICRAPRIEVFDISSESEEEQVPIKPPENLDKMIKNLDKMRTALGKKLPSNVGPVKNIQHTLKSKSVSKEVKRYILEQQPEYLREKFESYEVLSALGESSNHFEWTEEEKQLKTEFDAIKSVFGSKFEVEEFLKTQVNKKTEPNNQSKYSYLFEGLDERDFFDDNTKFIEEMFAKVPPEDHVDEKMEISSNFENDDDIEFVESKYLSQQQSPMSQKKSRTMSTPLNNNFKKRMPLKFDESPILKKNFVQKQISISKAFESTFEIPCEILEEPVETQLTAIVEEKEPVEVKSISNIFGEDSALAEDKKEDHPEKEAKDDDLFDSDFELEDLPDEAVEKKDFFNDDDDDDCFEFIEEDQNKYEFASPSKVKAAQAPVYLWNDEQSLVDLEEIKSASDLLDQGEQKPNNILNMSKELGELLTPEDFLEPFEEENTPIIVLSDSSSNDKENGRPSTPEIELEKNAKSPFIKKISNYDKVSPCVIRKRPSRIRPTRTEVSKDCTFKDIVFEEASSSKTKENEGRPTTPDQPIEIKQSIYKSPFVKKLEMGGDKSPSAIKRRPGLGSLSRKLMRNEASAMDESVIIMKKKPNRRILSDDESAEDSPLRANSKKKRARVVDSDLEDSPQNNKRSRLTGSDTDICVVRKRPLHNGSDSDSPVQKRYIEDDSVLDSPKVPKTKKRVQRGFVDDEAAHSGEDSSEGEQESMSEVSHYLLDSMIVSDSNVKDDSSVNMQAIYLQSLRSPRAQQFGRFKIPEPKPFNVSDIYSQAVEPETSVDYDSFVTEEEEDSYFTPCTANDISMRPELFLNGARNRHSKKEELSKKFKNLRDTFKNKFWK